MMDIILLKVFLTQAVLLAATSIVMAGSLRYDYIAAAALKVQTTLFFAVLLALIWVVIR